MRRKRTARAESGPPACSGAVRDCRVQSEVQQPKVHATTCHVPHASRAPCIRGYPLTHLPPRACWAAPRARGWGGARRSHGAGPESEVHTMRRCRVTESRGGTYSPPARRNAGMPGRRGCLELDFRSSPIPYKPGRRVPGCANRLPWGGARPRCAGLQPAAGGTKEAAEGSDCRQANLTHTLCDTCGASQGTRGSTSPHPFARACVAGLRWVMPPRAAPGAAPLMVLTSPLPLLVLSPSCPSSYG